MGSNYGGQAYLNIETEVVNGNTIVSDDYYSAPLALTTPFKMLNGGILIMTMNTSPGFLDHDDHSYSYKINNGSRVMVTNQGYEKIYKSLDNPPKKKIKVEVMEDAYFKYVPNPSIPYKESKLDASVEISLKSDTSKLCLVEIISGGRIGMGEKFKFSYHNLLTRIKQDKKLIYQENLRFSPQTMDLEGYGFFEKSTHFATIVCANLNINAEKLEKVRMYFKENNINGGITLTRDDLAVAKIFGDRGDFLINTSKEVVAYLEDEAIKFE